MNSIIPKTSGQIKTQVALGKAAGIGRRRINDLIHGRCNAGPELADRLSRLTSSDIRIWLKGGCAQTRMQAAKAWSMDKTQII